MSNTEVWKWLWLDEVLASVFSSDDDSGFGHLDSESEEEEDEGVSACLYLLAVVRAGEPGSA